LSQDQLVTKYLSRIHLFHLSIALSDALAAEICRYERSKRITNLMQPSFRPQERFSVAASSAVKESNEYEPVKLETGFFFSLPNHSPSYNR
jgi:hypothetical protein